MTHTDYVNSYPSVLQTMSYNFMATKTTGKICAGIVKGAGAYPKNAVQHATELSMLEDVATIQPEFINPRNGSTKQIECIRVDGATDKGPSHHSGMLRQPQEVLRTHLLSLLYIVCGASGMCD